MNVRSGKGDERFTDLFFHEIIKKDSPQIRTLGDLDELMSYLGLVKSKVKSGANKDILEKIQRDISIIASEIAVTGDKKKKMGILLKETQVDWIKKITYSFQEKIKIKSGFYLPGDGELSAFFDITRAVARRAERNIVSLFGEGGASNDNILCYMNCLSDVLFLLARKYSKKRKVN